MSDIKMSDAFISAFEGRLTVGSVRNELYQDIDHNMIDIAGKFDTGKQAKYAAIAINAYDANQTKIAEQEARIKGLKKTLEAVRDVLELCDVDCLGTGHKQGVQPWPIRDEVIYNIGQTLSKPQDQ